MGIEYKVFISFFEHIRHLIHIFKHFKTKISFDNLYCSRIISVTEIQELVTLC